MSKHGNGPHETTQQGHPQNEQSHQGQHDRHNGGGHDSQQHGQGHQDHGKDHNNASHNRPDRQRFPDPRHPDAHTSHWHNGHFDLAAAALDEMHGAGFKPEFTSDVDEQVADLRANFDEKNFGPAYEDLRTLKWSSIDNDTSKDLDQIEVADRVAENSIRLRVAIGDVAAAVPKDSPIDKHADDQTQTIYTAVRQFPMLPFDLSTDMTSLNEDQDRRAVMMTFTVSPSGSVSDEKVSLAVVRNRAQLAYSRVGPWLENAASGAPTGDPFELRSDSAREGQAQNEAQGAKDSAWLVDQLKLQDEVTQNLHKARVEAGALEFRRAEADPVVADGKVVDVHEAIHNRAMDLIEDVMVAANGVMARALRHGGRSGLQRVVVIPKRWDRIVTLAAEHGGELPAAPDSRALNDFLEQQRRDDNVHYPDLAVAIIKLMGPGEYMLMRPDDDPTGHFGLAARDYTHSTAPNRRYPDLVTQRVLHAMLEKAEAPYTDQELSAIAQHCNDADKELRKIERTMEKRVAAVALASRVGQTFAGVVTGASDKGVYVRVFNPPVEGRVIQNEDGLDVGDKVQVKLMHTDPERAFIDFSKVGKR